MRRTGPETFGGDLRRTFDQSSGIYHAARPRYPAVLFDRLFELLPEEPCVLEVGPGTGVATDPMLERSAEVRAIELGPSLAACLSARLAEPVAAGQLQVEVGDFEAVAIEPSSVDAVVSATAYHWITRAQQLHRPAQWLRPQGRLAVIDTIQVASDVDAGFFEAARPIYARFGQEGRGSTPSPEAAVPDIHARMEDDHRCRDLTLDRYRWDQTYSAEAYEKLLLTFSGPLSMAVDQRTAMVKELGALVAYMGGSVVRPLVMTLATCRFEVAARY